MAIPRKISAPIIKREKYMAIVSENPIPIIRISSVQELIPVIANGDVVDAKSASDCLAITGAAGLMIGRAAIGRPTIFHQIKSDLGWNNSEPKWADMEFSDEMHETLSARLWAWRRYIELDRELSSGDSSKNRLRHAFSFTKGLPGGKAFRTQLHTNREAKHVSESVEEFLSNLVKNVQINH
mgnify:CR=1 FL=1